MQHFVLLAYKHWLLIVITVIHVLNQYPDVFSTIGICSRVIQYFVGILQHLGVSCEISVATRDNWSCLWTLPYVFWGTKITVTQNY